MSNISLITLNVLLCMLPPLNCSLFQFPKGNKVQCLVIPGLRVASAAKKLVVPWDTIFNFKMLREYTGATTIVPSRCVCMCVCVWGMRVCQGHRRDGGD